MRSLRKPAFIAGGIISAAAILLLVLPWVFRGRIEAAMKAAVNETVTARVAWTGVGVGLLRDFPNVTMRVEGLTIVGARPFERDTLVAVRAARLVLDAGSVIGYLRRGDRIVVREVALRRPVVALRVLPDGRTNWDITRKTSPKGGTARSVAVTLRELTIEDGNISMNDEQAHLVASVKGLHETLTGDFGDERFVLGTHTRADTVSVRFAGIPYLTRVAISLDADVHADLPAKRFTFRNDSLRLNRLLLAFGGTVTLGKPDLTLDLSFSTPGTAFADILSLVPAVYAKDFEKVRTAGTMSASGRVRGQYGPNAFPALALRAKVERGSFRYPSLPLPARDIYLDLAIDNPGGHVDRTVVNLTRFHAAIGGRPLDATLVMRTPVTDPEIDLRLLGSVDLADVSRTVKLTGVSQLAGLVSADLAVHARLSDVDARRYDRVSAAGMANASRVALRADSIPHPIAVDTAALRFTPRTAELTAFASRIGTSDVRATGTLDNLLGYLLRGDDLRGTASVTSEHFDLDEWKSTEKTTTVIPVPPHVDFALAATAKRVTYAPLTMSNVRGNLRVKDQRVTLSDMRMEMLRGTVVANGVYETATPGRPTFDVDLTLAAVDIPEAFASLVTVQKLAPIARWTRGSVSGSVALRGPLAQDMMPVFAALSGMGKVETGQLEVHDSPVFVKLAETFAMERLRSPALRALKASFAVADGRVLVKPFVTQIAGVDLTVGGSNGIDQSIAYDMTLAVPKALLGGAAGGVVARLASQAGKPGEAGAGIVQLGAKVTGTFLNPSVRPNFGGMGASLREAAATAVQAELATRTAAVRERVDSAAEGARRRARDEANRVVAEAERQAAAIRAEARALAATATREGNERADSLLARATSPGARMAAKLATDRIRREAQLQADRIVKEADTRADALVTAARQKADALLPASAAPDAGPGL